MYSNHYTPYNQPNFSDLPKGEILNRLINLIEVSLSSFPGHLKSVPGYKTKPESVIEPFFNQEFSHCLQITASKIGLGGYFTYHDESANPQKLLSPKKKRGLERQVDIGIRLSGSYKRFLVIEGKRLHDKNDKQYVSGKTGGIARFKREEHGEDHGMDVACMLGYVQKESFSFWHGKINQWLDQEKSKPSIMAWENDEHLSSLQFNDSKLTTCTSKHKRIKLSSILLYHFWINVIWSEVY